MYAIIFIRRPSTKGEQTKSGAKDRTARPEATKSRDPKEPFKMAMPKNQIKLTLKTASGKPANQARNGYVTRCRFMSYLFPPSQC